MIVTRDEILDAIDEMYRDGNVGLCEAFCAGVPWWKSANLERITRGLCRFLRATGGKGAQDTYFWSTNSREGDQQRLLFLAFMLTWYDELEALP
jgi:hypothetical protein